MKRKKLLKRARWNPLNKQAWIIISLVAAAAAVIAGLFLLAVQYGRLLPAMGPDGLQQAQQMAESEPGSGPCPVEEESVTGSGTYEDPFIRTSYPGHKIITKNGTETTHDPQKVTTRSLHEVLTYICNEGWVFDKNNYYKSDSYEQKTWIDAQRTRLAKDHARTQTFIGHKTYEQVKEVHNDYDYGSNGQLDGTFSHRWLTRTEGETSPVTLWRGQLLEDMIYDGQGRLTDKAIKAYFAHPDIPGGQWEYNGSESAMTPEDSVYLGVLRNFIDTGTFHPRPIT